MDGHDAAAMHPLFDQNTNAHEPITQQVKEALTATDRHDEHARARTLPQDSQFLQPPSSEWNVSQYIPCSNCELATQNREPRAAVSHTCMHASGIRSRTQVKAPKKNHTNLTQNPCVSPEIATTWRSLHVDPVGTIGESAPDGASFPPHDSSTRGASPTARLGGGRA